MAITEQSRHDLYVRLEAALGAQEATTLMEHLPPVGWADVSTRTDVALQLQALEGNLRAEFHLAFGDFRDEIRRDRQAAQRQLLFVLVVAVVSLLGTVATSL